MEVGALDLFHGQIRKILSSLFVKEGMKVFFLFLLCVHPVVALDYKRDVMPIFKEKCYDCHSDEAKKVKGGLRLDDEEHFAKRFSENEVVVPGDWDASYLFVTLVMARDEKGSMPPKNKGEALTEEEIKLVAQWIHEGAKINGETGKKGPDQWDPAKTLKFKDGRVVTEQFGPAPVVKELAWETWMNKNGREIVARFQGLKEGKVTFELKKTGEKVDYPLEGLSEESREKVKGLMELHEEKMME